jgi:predicted O-methyltransferase YrrM
MPTFHGPDWFSQHIPNWKRWLARFQGRDGIRAVEIGTYEGRAACWLLDNVLTGRNCELTCIDPHSYDHADAVSGERFSSLRPETVRATWLENLADAVAAERCRLVREPSSEGLQLFLPLPQWDFVYVDGSHLARCCLEDSILVWERLHPGGICIWDDYRWRPPRGRTSPSCHVAIDAFLACYEGCYDQLEKGHQVKVRKLR